MKRVLINHTNHPSNRWSEEQRLGWDVIVDLPFPNVPADADVREVNEMTEKYLAEIKDIVTKYPEAEIYVMLQGEYTYCYIMFMKLKRLNYKIAIPTTERRVIDLGEGKSVTEFRFVRWRFL